MVMLLRVKQKSTTVLQNGKVIELYPMLVAKITLFLMGFLNSFW